jgi:uncharacterized membrane protein
MPPGSVEDATGNANRLDHFEQWAKLNPYAMIVYTIGDINCHQISERSIYLNGNQMPVCARCAGLAIGFFIGSLLFIFTIPDADVFKMALTPILRKKVVEMTRKKAIILVILLAGILIGPLAFDGLLQILTNYTSNNTLRLGTGLFAGIAIILALGSYFESFVYRSIYLKKEENQLINIKN